MLRKFAKLLLRLGGWETVGGAFDVPRAVCIAAPHTSNWDGFWALTYKVAFDIDIRFFAKHSLFWFPLGNLLRALGGINLDRDRAGSAVTRAIEMFGREETFYFGLAPEGTRRKTSGWKTGFYRIALGAGVPVYLGFLDFGRRRIGIGPRIELTGDQDADLATIREFYKDVQGRWPEKASPIVFPAAAKKRTVRSFVRRAGRITASQQRALDELWPRYGLDYAENALDFETVYGRTAPVVVEIGFGNGDTFVEQAAANPDRDYLGIEVHEPGVGHCLLRTEEAGIENVRVIAHDAIEVLGRQVPPSSVSRLNLYFPDPWPKKRHHKRRIVQDSFVELVADRLVAGGTLNIATDWANYAEHIDEVLGRSDRFKCIERRVHDGEAPLDRPQTKFERRGLGKGHRIVDWCFERLGNT
jgi:tRNA (guanine-N7-)-methyltransferase